MVQVQIVVSKVPFEVAFLEQENLLFFGWPVENPLQEAGSWLIFFAVKKLYVLIYLFPVTPCLAPPKLPGFSSGSTEARFRL